MKLTDIIKDTILNCSEHELDEGNDDRTKSGNASAQDGTVMRAKKAFKAFLRVTSSSGYHQPQLSI